MKYKTERIKKIAFLWLSYSKDAVIFFSVFIVIICFYFLFKNCYQTIGEARTVEILKKQVALNVADIELWKEINKEIEWKQQPLQEGVIEINPFE